MCSSRASKCAPTWHVWQIISISISWPVLGSGLGKAGHEGILRWSLISHTYQVGAHSYGSLRFELAFFASKPYFLNDVDLFVLNNQNSMEISQVEPFTFFHNWCIHFKLYRPYDRVLLKQWIPFCLKQRCAVPNPGGYFLCAVVNGYTGGKISGNSADSAIFLQVFCRYYIYTICRNPAEN